MVTKRTGRLRGRPPLPLREDPERFWVAQFCTAVAFRRPDEPERQVALKTVMLRHGALIPTSAMEIAGGRLDVFDGEKRRYRYIGRPSADDGKTSRNSTAFHPRADDLIRKRRRILDSVNADDLEWLATMARAWAWADRWPSRWRPFDQCFETASAYCAKAGEMAFFDTVLAPMLRHQFGIGLAPQFCATPEFIPNYRGRELP